MQINHQYIDPHPPEKSFPLRADLNHQYQEERFPHIIAKRIFPLIQKESLSEWLDRKAKASLPHSSHNEITIEKTLEILVKAIKNASTNEAKNKAYNQAISFAEENTLDVTPIIEAYFDEVSLTLH